MRKYSLGFCFCVKTSRGADTVSCMQPCAEPSWGSIGLRTHSHNWQLLSTLLTNSSRRWTGHSRRRTNCFAEAISVGHAQYTTHPGDIPNRHGNFRRRGDSRSPSRSTSLYQQLRSKSPYHRTQRDADVRTLNPRWNLSTQPKILCYRCWSDQYVPSDRKCPSTIQSIATYITELNGYGNDDVNINADEFAQLFASQKMVLEKPTFNTASEKPWRTPSKAGMVASRRNFRMFKKNQFSRIKLKEVSIC